MYLNSLPQDTLKLFQTLSYKDFLSEFYLSGGTALSLQLNHRQSEDLDFFIQKKFKPEYLLNHLQKIDNCQQIQIDEGTLNLYLNNVKLQFLYYPYDLLKEFKKINLINISSVLDIACTKLITISSRGSKKDFIDLYFLLKKYSLNKLFKNLAKKYQKLDYNQIHILKSLTYFEDANKQPDPQMLKSISWSEVKKQIIKTVKNYPI